MDAFVLVFLVLTAGFLQGTFVLPTTLVHKWKWENIWLVFSFFGMLIFNLLLAFIFVSDLPGVYSSVATNDLVILIIFGTGWGVGSVLFGIGMKKLGMSLGYPIIMGLTASMGGLLPMFIHHTSDVLTLSGLLMMAGTLVVIAGIIACSKAASGKDGKSNTAGLANGISGGIVISVFAGLLSSLPNIGFSYGSSITETAIALGTSPAMAGNAVWALFFTAGFFPNMLYTVYLLRRNKSGRAFFTQAPGKNFFLGIIMAIMWIGSFYLYGISSVKMGSWGAVVGWPVFISLSIVIGNLWGIWRGEWQNASRSSRLKLNWGLIILILGMAITGLSNIF